MISVNYHQHSSSPSAFIHYYTVKIKDDKAKPIGEGLVEDPLGLDMRAMVCVEEFSILALDWRSISMDLSLLKSSSIVRVL